MKRLTLFLCALLSTTILSALPIPPLNEPVTDLAGLLRPDARQRINSYLHEVHNQTGVHIAVFTIPSLEGETIEEYSMSVAEKWQLGQKDADNGVLLLIALNDRAMRIEVGYGLEGTLTDTKSGLIIREVMAPRFREGNWELGIYDAVRTIAGITTGNEDWISKAVSNPETATNSSGNGPVLIAFILFYLLFSITAGRRKGGLGGGFLWPFVIMSLLNQHQGHSSGRGGFSGWGGSGGGFSGGGFSGGGGSFGGGGASGGW